MLVRGDNSSAVQWVINCKRGRGDQVRTGALMRMLEALETEGGWCFQAKHVRGLDNRWEGEGFRKNLAKESPQTVWQVQELEGEEQWMCSEFLREDTPLDGLRRRLERLTRRIGGCG